jgi:folate-binding protein YgfZ
MSLGVPSNQSNRIDQALTESAVVLEPGWGTLRVAGADRATWLNGVVTCDVVGVDRTRGGWGVLLSKQGKIEAELHIASTGDELLVATPPGAAEKLGETFDRYLVMEDAELAEASSDVTWLALHGPRAVDLAKSCASALASARLDWTRAGGALLALPLAARAACVESLRAQGAVCVSLDEWEPARIRLGLPRFGVDYDGSDNPHEAGLERRVISWTKGCYLGQEVVCMQDMRGKVKRRLVRLELAAPIAPGVELLASSGEGAGVGVVKSTAGSFAIASVRAPSYESGSEVVASGAKARVLPLSE